MRWFSNERITQKVIKVHLQIIHNYAKMIKVELRKL